jgi:hypothetical protein
VDCLVFEFRLPYLSPFLSTEDVVSGQERLPAACKLKEYPLSSIDYSSSDILPRIP